MLVVTSRRASAVQWEALWVGDRRCVLASTASVDVQPGCQIRQSPLTRSTYLFSAPHRRAPSARSHSLRPDRVFSVPRTTHHHHSPLTAHQHTTHHSPRAPLTPLTPAAGAGCRVPQPTVVIKVGTSSLLKTVRPASCQHVHVWSGDHIDVSLFGQVTVSTRDAAGAVCQAL